MKNKLGSICIILGVALLLGALLLFLINRKEDLAAQQASRDVLTQLVQQIQEDTAKEIGANGADVELQIPVELLTEEDKKMAELEIDGELYIGYLNMPKIGMSLPVQSTWSYPKLKISPCRYSGSVRGEDMVIMAHNYTSHFGKISELEPGDQVIFTDVEGNVIYYQVVTKDVLAPTAVEEMTAGEFDLTLFTCTYGGANRVTVYCQRTV